MIRRRTLLAGLAGAISAPATAEVAGHWRRLYKSQGAAAPRRVIDVAEFGFRAGPGDNGAAQETMRQHAIANPSSVYRFAAGTHYDLTTPRFLYGVRDIEIIATGASFRNINAGTFGYEDVNVAFFMGSGSFFHPMTGGNIDPKRATSGELIDDTVAGATSVRLINRVKVANFRPGTWALVHWFSRQKRAFPPNPAYFDYVKITTADPVTGALRLDRPLTFAYKSIASDDSADPRLYGSICGRARILSLERPDYQICERFVLHGGIGLMKGFNKRPEPNNFDGMIAITGVIEAELNDVEFEAFGPSLSRTVTATRCKFTGVTEMDKILEAVTLVDCDLADTSQASGVRVFTMRGGRLSSRRPGWSSQIRAHSIQLKGVEVACQSPRRGGAQLSVDAYAKRLIDIDGCTFRPNAEQGSALGPGDGVLFTPDRVSATSLTIAPTNPAREFIIYAIDFGSMIWLAEGDSPSRFTVADIGFDTHENLVLTGTFDDSGPGDPKAARRLASVRRFVDRPNNKIVNAPPGFRLLPITHAIAEPRMDNATSGPRQIVIPMSAGEYHVPPVEGVITGVTVRVDKPYTGTDPVALLEINKQGVGATHDFGSINLKVAGTRHIGLNGAKGAAPADRLNGAIPPDLWVEFLVLHVHGGTQGAFKDAAAEHLPKVEVTVAMR
jgi:hypothetical protein